MKYSVCVIISYRYTSQVYFLNKTKLCEHTDLNVTRQLASYSKFYLAITPYWNIQTADLSLDFLIHFKMKELDPLTNHNHDHFDDFN